MPNHKKSINSLRNSQPDLYKVLACSLEIWQKLKQHPNPRREMPPVAGKTGIVTEADMLIDREIIRMLETYFVEDGILTEESGYNPPRSGRTIWVIDPLDGSKEYHNKIAECCICVARINQQTNLAIAVNPISGEYMYADGLGTAWHENGQMHTSNCINLDEANITVSRSEHSRGWWDDFGLQTVPMGSIAWKIIQVAAGNSDATITYTPKNIWDVAAAIYIAESAGCIVTDALGRPLVLDPLQPLIQQGIIVAAPGIAKALIDHTAPWVGSRPRSQMDAR